MAEEKKTEEQENKISFKTADELSNFLLDLQGQISNLTEIVDKLSPVEESSEEGSDPAEETKEELTDEEVFEIDRLLQSE